MKLKRILILLGSLFLFSACSAAIDSNLGLQPPKDQPLELTKLSAKGISDQLPADQAKRILSEYDEVQAVRAVNDRDTLLIGVKLNHFDRFRMDDIERRLRKKVKRDFSEMNIKLSTDEKIHFELTKLEDAIVNKEITKKDIKKRMKKIEKLSGEET